MPTDFYSRFGEVSLGLLGLWLVVVTVYHQMWVGSPFHRRQATAVSMIFGLPGGMSLLTLVDPTTPRLWHWTFIIGGSVGCVWLLIVAAERSPHGQSPVIQAGLLVGGLLYGAIAGLAIWAFAAGNRDLDLHPVKVEAVLFSLLLLVGVVIAWSLLFPHGAAATTPPPPPQVPPGPPTH